MANEARLIQEHGPNWTPERHYDHLRCVNPGRACPCCLQTCPICRESDLEESQVTPMDNEISNERAAELTAARVKIARLLASISVLRTHVTRMEAGITEAVRGHMFYHDEYGASIPLEALQTHIMAMMIVNAPQPVTRPFSGEGRRLDD